MKRVASVLLLSIFLYNAIGYCFFFFLQEYENNRQAAFLIQSQKNLETLYVQRSELKNVAFSTDKKEISYDGEMYDVRDYSFSGNYIVFHCMDDKKETSSLAYLDTQVKNNTDSKSSSGEKQHKVLKNVIKDYFPARKRSFFLFPKKRAFASHLLILTPRLSPPIPFTPPEFFIA